MAFNKYTDTGIVPYSFRCYCSLGYTSKEQAVPQWNKNQHPKTFMIVQFVSESPWMNVQKTTWEEDMLILDELIKVKAFESKEFKDMVYKHGREKVIDYYLSKTKG